LSNPNQTNNTMTNDEKLELARYIRSVIGEKNIRVGDMAKAMNVTTQTVRNIKGGNVSDQLLLHARITVDTWEASK
jgi:DNA-binding XRE family transcriptional regulator